MSSSSDQNVLVIKKFSCIEQATIRYARFMILIGPQASGKSVISKLSYFFISNIFPLIQIIREGKTVDDYKAFLKEAFLKNFPDTAWGGRQFELKVTLGNISILLIRTRAKSLSKSIKVVLSQSIIDFATEAAQLVKNAKSISTEKEDLDPHFKSFLARIELDSSMGRLLDEKVGSRFLISQFFIPAARSFFTSTRKMLSAYEALANVDPITIKFGKAFAEALDTNTNRFLISDRKVDEKKSARLERLRRNFAKEMFGGDFEVVNEVEYLRTADGRLVPLTHLSSGQQEIMPFLRVIESMLRNSRFGMIYIEEPEAHLFPDAQSKIISFLVSLMAENPNDNLFITTHSPYILNHINNLLKAGQIMRQTDGHASARITRTLGDKNWIYPGDLVAYGILDGIVENIIDSEGYVSTMYIDKISDRLGAQFQRLIDLQVADD